MAFEDPVFIDGLSLSGQELRHAENLHFQSDGTAAGSQAGIRPGDPGLKVTLTGMSISVANGVAAVSYPGQGVYRTYSNSTWTGTVSTAHASLQRLDLVYLRVYDNAVDASGFSKSDAIYLAGTAGSGTLPTPAGTQIWIPLAQITVPAGSTTPSVADLRPAAVAPGGIAPIPSASLATAGLYVGHARYNLVRQMIETWTGSAWVAQGDWISYTPTWAAVTTNPTLGVGATLAGRYSLIGKTCTVKVEMATSSNTLFGNGQYTWAIPFVSAGAGNAVSMGSGHGITPGLRWALQGLISSGQTAVSVLTPTNSGDVRGQFVSSTLGMGGVAWATAQTMRVQVTYEIA